MTFPIQDQLDQIKNAIESANQKVIFSAIRHSYPGSGDVNEETTITYDEANVNVGGGMDAGSGNFTVPVSGIYSFSFRGMSQFKKLETGLEVRKNNAKQFDIFFLTEGTMRKPFDILSTTWIMNLSQNDVISLYISVGGLAVYGHPVFFDGHLVMKQ